MKAMLGFDRKESEGGDGAPAVEPGLAKLALAGFLSMAAALGIGRFAYTPILPFMLDALGLPKSQAGFIGSANFLGYLVGAIAAASGVISRQPRRWLLLGLVLSGATTALMALASEFIGFTALRFLGGVASALVIICGSALLLGPGRSRSFSAIHFAGVGGGITVSAVLVPLLASAGWRWMWIAGGLASLLAFIPVAVLTQGKTTAFIVRRGGDRAPPGSLLRLILAYGLFGFGYVITATFLVTIVRESVTLRPIEPWVWVIFGLSAAPSVLAWTFVGARWGLMHAFATACVLEAIGVFGSVEWRTSAGAIVSTALLGGTFMGLTALGLIAARQMSGPQPHRAIAWMTTSFAVGQVIGPALAGISVERTGSFQFASLLASASLVVAALLVFGLRTQTEAHGRREGGVSPHLR